MGLSELFRALGRRLAGRRDAAGGRGAAELGEIFRSRYHSFKLLLAANNKALDLMSEMELAVRGDRVFGMAFVRSRSTATAVSVYRMVRHLEDLAPGKFPELGQRFEAIQASIQARLAVHPAAGEGPLVVPFDEVDRTLVAEVGAKMAHLGEAGRRQVGLRIPRGFVITAAAFQLMLSSDRLQDEIDRLIQASEIERTDELFALSSRLQQLIVGAAVPDALADAIARACERMAADLGREPRLAMRSSALGEDSAEASFAGQYRTELNVQPANLLDAYRTVLASKYTPQAMHYRLQRGLRDDDVAMCVGCLEMVDAVAGGVAYTAHPRAAGDRDIYISATWGLPAAVVDGRFGSDLLRVERDPPHRVVSRSVARKEQQLVVDPVEGIGRQQVARDLVEQPAIDDRQAAAVADAALRLEEHFGHAQDVEWAIAGDGEVVVLQCRPLTPVAGVATSEPPDGAQVVARGGVTASPGAAAGPVAWVRRDSDALGFPDGGVLVVDQPLPRWAALLGRAAAVVAAQGGIAGHLATVAREFRVPALVGLGSATGALADGALVTVDADHGMVLSGRVAELISERPGPSHLMVGSPVHSTLVGVLEQVAPLSLLDPDALSFRAANCRTLHDITRFCHEQAVREMFSFGREQRFPERASKQLHHNVPMQWWVLDLEDGFRHAVEGKYVRLDDIACAPMRAIWDGMVAVVWEGPPAISGRGLASVLFEATRNPALGSPFARTYTNRNYFMISRYFMNLQSRFGFHFSTVETVAGPRPEENYIAFSFKGGAADLDRRAARARLVAELMEDRGFAVRVVEDSATARLAGLDSAATEARLRIVGYLIMHTRQLDMVMAEPAAVEHYRAKLARDIEGLG